MRPWWWILGAAVVAAAVLAAVRLEHPPASAIEVFFVRYPQGGRAGTLVPVPRVAPRGGADVRLAAALRALLAGPSAGERHQGLVSEIPPGTRLRSVRISGGVATVDLTGAFGGGGGSTSMLARVWQVVYTATQTPAARSAQILLGGRRVEALGGEGVLIGRPITRPAEPPAF